MPCKTDAHPLLGKRAPDFTLESSSGRNLKLSSLRGNCVVLYFYPKDDTSGCTIEAKGFRDISEKINNAGAIVLGISPDSVASHCKFISKHGLNFQLLADPEHSVAEKFGVWAEKSMYGKKYMGIVRTTFLIDKNSRISHIWSKVKPQGHAEEVLQVINSMKE